MMHKSWNGIVFFVLSMSFYCVAALSASTANTIQGTKPVLSPGSGPTSLATRSSFKVGANTYKEFDNSYTSSILFTSSLKLTDFNVIGLSTTDFDSGYYYDNDGDGYHNTTPLVIGGLTYSWIDNNNSTIYPIDYNKSLQQLADSGFVFPLTLEIINSGIQVRSRYGDPDLSQPVDITKKYLISYEADVYAIKPASTGKECQWIERIYGVNHDPDGWVCSSQSTPWQNGHIDPLGGGYTSDYMPDIGFKHKPSGNKFPTVGFPGAEFQIVMAGNQSDYAFSVHSGSGVLVNSSTGVVKLDSNPNSAVTIRALNTITNVHYDYTFTITKWFVPKTGTYSYDSAIAVCGSESNILSRSDFTNSPIASISTSTNWSYVRNYGTRGINGTLYGEWGYLGNHTYPSSDWVANRYWTKDINQNNSPHVNQNFFVHSYDGGYIGYEWNDNSGLGVVCK